MYSTLIYLTDLQHLFVQMSGFEIHRLKPSLAADRSHGINAIRSYTPSALVLKRFVLHSLPVNQADTNSTQTDLKHVYELHPDYEALPT